MAPQSHTVSRDGDAPPAQPTRIELPSDLRDELLDPAIWQEGLEAYALATHLAVALTDAEGRRVGKCVNPQPTWGLFDANRPAGVSGCPFSLMPLKPCTCTASALAKGGLVLAR